MLAQVGDDPTLGPPEQTVEGKGDELHYRMKLLKLPAVEADPWLHRYALRNIYSLGRRTCRSPSPRPAYEANVQDPDWDWTRSTYLTDNLVPALYSPGTCPDDFTRQSARISATLRARATLRRQ